MRTGAGRTADPPVDEQAEVGVAEPTSPPGHRPDTFFGRVATLLPFAREDAGRYAVSAVLASIGTLCQLGPFYVIYLAIEDLLAGQATASGMAVLAVAVLALLVAHYALMAAAMLISHRAAFQTLSRLRMRVGHKLARVPLGKVTGTRSGEIQRTLSEDVERLEAFLAHAIPDLAAAVVVVTVTTGWMLAVDWRLALAAVACIVVAAVLSSTAVRRSQDLMAGYLAALGRMNGSIVELIRGLPVVRTFNRAGDTFTETSAAIRAAADYQADWGLRLLPLYTGFFTLAAAPVVTILPVGLLLWAGDEIAVVDLLFFLVIGLGYGAPVTKLVTFTAQLTQVVYGAHLVRDLELAAELPEASTPAVIRDGSVEFRDVSFAYPDSGRAAVSDLSFHAAPATLTALVGPSGAGKSTVARLICRFHDVDGGAVLVGGADVRDVPFGQLMGRVSFVFQETFLFDDTVEANLRLAKPDAEPAELERACRAARAHEFITALPEGYATPVGERGGRLSGGQRQRLAIARAFLRDTDIIVLDEATAFMDPENEVALQEAITALVADRTVIMVAHRLTTIAGADQILVVRDGRVTERGTHGDLLATRGLYADMWQAAEASDGIALGEAVHAAGQR